MFSTEQRRIAIEAFIRFDHSHADTIAEPGYPTRHSLRAWYKDYLEHGEVGPPKRRREPKFTLEMRQAAVDYYLAHGKSLAGTMRRMGCPASREYLCDWIDELAPGQRKYGGAEPESGPRPARGEDAGGGRARVPRRNRCGGRREARRAADGVPRLAKGDDGR